MTSYKVFVNGTADAQMRCEDGQLTLTRLGEDRSKEKTIRGELIKHVDWITCGRLATIQLYTKSNELYVVSRIEASEEATLCTYFQESLGVQPVVQHASVAGKIDGELSFGECSFSLVDNGSPIITIPYSRIHQVQAPSSGGIILNLLRDKGHESLTSLQVVTPKEFEKNSRDLRADIESRVDLTAGTEDFVASVDNVKFVRPRLQLNMRFCRDLVLLSNEDVAHRVFYDDIECVHRLEIPTESDEDARKEFMVITLRSMPLRHGQTSYSHIVMQASDDNEAHGKGLDDSRVEADQLADLFERFDVKVISTGFYNTPSDDKGIYCRLRAQQGHLYLTADAFVYVHNPVVILKYRDVARVAFEKVEELHKHGKTFDLTVEKVSDKQKMVFKDINMAREIKLLDIDDDDERMEVIELQKRRKRVEGIKSLIKWFTDKKVKIQGMSELNNELMLLERVSTSSRAARLEGERRVHEQIREKDSDESSESDDRDFNPDARKGEEEESSESEGDSEGEDEETAEGAASESSD